MNKKIIAFTLAEVLIVASIIGVIGALTIPNLKKSQSKSANVARAKAAYTKLDSALRQIDMNKVLIISANNTDKLRSKALLDAMANYLKLSTNCGFQTASNYCFTKDAITDGSGYITNANSPVGKGDSCSTAVLNDGTEFAVCLTSNSAELDATTSNNTRGMIFVDVDGRLKGDNVRGRDIFVFQVGEDGLQLIQQNGYNTSNATLKLEDAVFIDEDLN